MKWVDGSIELADCGSSGRKMATFGAWEDRVLEHCFDHVEWISLHTYLNNYADDLKQLGDRGARARARLTEDGAVVVQEGIGMEAAFWSQLPGNIEWRTRPGELT